MSNEETTTVDDRAARAALERKDRIKQREIRLLNTPYTVTVEVSMWELAQMIKGIEVSSKRLVASARRRVKKNKRQIPGDLASSAAAAVELDDLRLVLTDYFMEVHKKREANQAKEK